MVSITITKSYTMNTIITRDYNITPKKPEIVITPGYTTLIYT